MNTLLFQSLFKKAESLIKLVEEFDLDTLKVPVCFGLLGLIIIKRRIERPAAQSLAIRRVIQTPEQAPQACAELAEIVSPMVGTFTPKVVVGQEIEVGDIIGIIEAMRLKNEIPSEISGIVAKILVPDDPDNPDDPVQYGQPLIRVVTKITHR